MSSLHRLKRRVRRTWQSLIFWWPTWRDLTRPFRRLRRRFKRKRYYYDHATGSINPQNPDQDLSEPAGALTGETKFRKFLRQFRRRASRMGREFRIWWPTWPELTAPFSRWRRHSRYARRDYRQFWFGIPAVLALFGWIGFAVLLLAWTPATIQIQYYLTAHQAMAAGQYGKARVAFERLLQMDTKSNDSYVFGLALSLKNLGQEQEAAALLASLAPLDATGFPPAHMLIARSILSDPNGDGNSLNKAELHLKRIVAVQPDNFEARMMLGQLFARTGQWDQAKAHLVAAYATRKEAALTLAVVAAYQNDETEFRRWAEQARKYFKAQVEARPGEPLLRISWAEATLMLGEYAGALNIMETGIMKSGDAGYYQMAARVYNEWAKNVAKASPDDLGKRLNLIQRGLEYAANNEQLLMQLIALSHLTGKEAEQARGRLNKLLTQGGGTGILHLCLGIDAWQRKRLEEARQHFSLAYEMAPQMPYVANNMAMILAVGEKMDLARALGIIQSVVDKFPKDPHFRDTRGKILIKLGRWREAVKDLEYALPLLPAKNSTHTSLAEAYRQLGLGELAAEHERLAALDKKKGNVPVK